MNVTTKDFGLIVKNIQYIILGGNVPDNCNLNKCP